MHAFQAMLHLLRNLFGQRRSRFGFGRRDPVVTPRRGGMALGTLAAIAAPFIIKKLRARMDQQQPQVSG
jgi:hypothetical protein